MAGAPKQQRSHTFNRLFTETRNNARRRNIPFRLTRSDLSNLIMRSQGRCEITGIPFQDATFPQSRSQPYRISIDRRDNRKGYTMANCRLVCICVNLAMSDWGEPVLIAMAKALLAKGALDEQPRGSGPVGPEAGAGVAGGPEPGLAPLRSPPLP